MAPVFVASRPGAVVNGLEPRGFPRNPNVFAVRNRKALTNLFTKVCTDSAMWVLVAFKHTLAVVHTFHQGDRVPATSRSPTATQ